MTAEYVSQSCFEINLNQCLCDRRDNQKYRNPREGGGGTGKEELGLDRGRCFQSVAFSDLFSLNLSADIGQDQTNWGLPHEGPH